MAKQFRDKKQAIGIIMGTICFLPAYAVAMVTGAVTSLAFGIAMLIVTQCMWLVSITLCTFSLEMENRALKASKDKTEKSLWNTLAELESTKIAIETYNKMHEQQGKE